MRRNPMILGRARWAALAVVLMSVASLFVITAGAQAVVVNDSGTVAGVALVPTARGLEGSYLTPAGVSTVTSSGSCADPAAATEPDILTAGSWPLSGPAAPLCWQGGPVMHANETFTLEWEGQAPNTYWSTTKGFVQGFLSDVASASGQRVSPYSDTTQYWDGGTVQNRAAYSSAFGGGCDDNGTAKCQFGSTTGSGPGNSLPSSSSCPVTGNNIFGGNSAGGSSTTPNNLCVTDTQIQGEVKSLIANDALIAHTQPGHTPLVTVLTPPGVVVCLDSAGHLCSVNGSVAPPPPVPTTSTTGGTIAAGAYGVEVTYHMPSGESVPSAPTIVTTTGGTSTITIPSPPAQTGATGWSAYVTQPNGSLYTLQGSQAMGTALTLTAPPTGSGTAPPGNASFCSYHSQLVDPQSGQPVSYVVQPWSAFSICDEPDIPAVAPYTPPSVIEKSAGQRLVSPLSQASMAAIVNPRLNGWVGQNGLEINDQNACQPEGHGLDSFSFGTSGQAPYFLQRESNNASVVDSDPWTYNGCVPEDVLQPSFVAPSAINLGDTIDLDGSATASSLDIPNAGYSWSFGDGSTGTGPSVEHSYGSAGNFTVTLTVTDRGGNQASLSQTVSVLGANGLPNSPSNPPSTVTPNVASNGALQVRMQLLPQGLRQVLRHGVSVQVSSNESANGIAQVIVSRATARRLHIRTGLNPWFVIGSGTISQVRNGKVVLHLYLSRATKAKLRHVNHVTLTVRLSLVGPGGDHLAVDAAGRY